MIMLVPLSGHGPDHARWEGAEVEFQHLVKEVIIFIAPNPLTLTCDI